MATADENTISVDQLQVGIYVHLDLGWMDHPFSFSSFKIRTEDQIQIIRQIGLKTVRWSPDRSDLQPKPLTQQPTIPAGDADKKVPTAASALSAEMQAAKQARIQKLKEHRERVARVEKEFLNTARIVNTLDQTIFSLPEQTLNTAAELVKNMVSTLLAAPDMSIQVMGGHSSFDEAYSPALNVSVLSMILARELGLPEEVVNMVGMGALFHDIGMINVPAKIIKNPGPLTKPEREFLEMHCQYGVDIGKKAGLPASALRIIHQHHERYDGLGYPQKLKGDATDPLARIVVLVKAFDHLCNPPQVAIRALTPHEALSQLFKQNRSWFDPKLLQLFIRIMGVYPAGTIVGLSNDTLALVIAVNATQPLKPTVLIYDPDVPRQEAIVLDMAEEADVNITHSLRPDQLSPKVFEYLSPRRRTSYYFDSGDKP